MSVGGEVRVEVGYKSGIFVPLSNYKINAMNKDYFYVNFFREG